MAQPVIVAPTDQTRHDRANIRDTRVAGASSGAAATTANGTATNAVTMTALLAP